MEKTLSWKIALYLQELIAQSQLDRRSNSNTDH